MTLFTRWRGLVAAILTAGLTSTMVGALSAGAADAAVTAPDHLVVAAVYGGSGGTSTYDWVELYNPTDSDISLGSISGSTVTPSFYLCYRGASASACSTSLALWGVVRAHHYFFVAESGTAGPAANGVTPDLDFSAAAKNAAGKTGTNMGGSTTGGQMLLLGAASNGVATMTGDLSSAAAQSAGVVDAVGWAKSGSQPGSAETGGATTVTGANGGTVNSNVIARTFVDGVPQDTDKNADDFTAVDSTTFVQHSQTSDHVAVAPVADTEISRGEAMTPIQVHGSKGTGTLTYAADGLPDGVTIDASSGVISGTPAATDDLKDYPVTVTVSDSTPTGPEAATTSFTLTVSDKLRVDALADVSVRKGAALTPIQVTAHGGTPGYHYAATGLPAGVDIDPASGVISGTPTDVVARYGVHVTVTDSGVDAAAQTVSTDFTLVERPRATGPDPSDPSAGLRINEVEATGTPADDWVELVNTGSVISGASVALVDDHGDAYHLPVQDVAAGGYVVVDGTDLQGAGLDLTASGTLDLTGTDDAVLDETSWTSYPSTSWARFPDGTGDFAVSATATRGAANAAPAVLTQDGLVVAAVYGADGTTFNSDWVELYNPTDRDISLGTLNADGTVTPNYYQCYRSNAGTSCSSMKLYGTVHPHHYFLVWNGHNADTTVDAHSKGVPPAGVTPDLDFRYGSNDTNPAATATANDPSGQVNNGFGGCNTGGQLWLLDAASNGTAPTGNLATAAAKATVVDGVGWTASGTTQPAAYETTGLHSGTNNACVIARDFKYGRPVDSDDNDTDFSLRDPATFTLHSQASTHVAITPVDDAEISLHEAMTPITVHAQAVYGDLTFAATGLPDGISIDPTTGVISGTPDAGDPLSDYSVTVTVGDGVASDTAQVSFTMTLSTVLRLEPIADVSVAKGAALTDVHPAAHGGQPPYTYSATGLPAGVSIDASTGVISGSPTDALGRYTVHVTATDSGTGDQQSTASRDFTIRELPSTSGPADGDPLAGLRINEVRATADPSNEWVELYDTGAAVSGASLVLEDSAGDTFPITGQDVAADGFAVLDGAALHAAGLDLAAKDTLYLAEADGTLLDQTSWTSYPPTSWARTTDGTGDFAVSAYPTKGAPNSGAPVIHPNDLLVSEVNYDNNSTDYYEYSEITNTTDHAIDFDAYGLTITKSGAVMTLHDPSDTSASSPLVDPVIPAHATQVLWWVENQYLGVKTTAQFLANYGLPQSTPVVLVEGFSSMANSGGDHSYYISVNQGSDLVSRAWVDTPCAANTLNGSAVCTATNNNYAEHYAVPADRTSADAAVWYNSVHSQGDDMNYPLAPRLSTPGTVDLEQPGFTRAVKLSLLGADAVTLHNTANAPVDLSGYVLQKNGAGAGYTLPAGTTVAAGADLAIPIADSGLSFGDRDYATLLAPRGFAYSDGVGIADTTGPLLKTVPYDASSGQPPVIDETTGLPLPPAGGLYRPAGVSADNGVVYVSNTGDNVLAAIANGANTIVAGSLGGYGDLGDEGPATDAELYQPGGVAQDAHGDLFIADSGDDVVREITPDGTIHRFAGTGVAGGEGAAVTPTSTPLTVNLWHPDDVAVDSAGNVFIADTDDNRVLEVTTAGAVQVVAGTGRAGYTGDGTAATGARLSEPAGIAVDTEDDLYIADSSNNVVRRVDAATGVITTVAGDYAADQADNGCLGAYGGDGGPATSALLNDPQGVALDDAGDLFIADTFNNAIREVTPDGTISTLVNDGAVAGAGNSSPVGNGSLPATTKLNTPYAVAVDRATNTLYVADTKNNVLDQVLNAAHGGDAGGPVEPADQVAVTGSGTAANACAVLANGPVVSTAPPAISGTQTVGSVLTASTGSWTPTPDSFTYQWLRDGTAIPGADQATYTVTAADGGHVLSVSVTASKDGFAPASATSAAVSIAPPDDSPGDLTTATPTVTGTFKVGDLLTAHPGAWKAGTAAVTSFTYQWLRNGVPIGRATGATYRLTATDRGRTVSVRVTGSYPGYTTASATSTGRVVAAGTLTTSLPRISGRAQVGKVLTARPGTWRAGSVRLTGRHLAYQWYAGSQRIKGATRATYRIARKYRHQRISVRVTGSYPGYTTKSRTSAKTAAVK